MSDGQRTERDLRRDLRALERRRIEAVRLVAQGISQTEVARRLRVSRQSVNRWTTISRELGEQGLRGADRAGRKPELSVEQREKLRDLLARRHSAKSCSCAQVARLIYAEFGIAYHPGHVWKVLTSLGWRQPRGPAVLRARG